MGKRIIFILAAACILSQAGCGNQGSAEKTEEGNPPVQEEDSRTEEPESESSQIAAEESRTPVSVTSVEEEPDAALTPEQIEEAKQAALAYYEGTVFTVNTIEHFEGKLPYGDMEGTCKFIVNVSKGGVVQEPDRTISLQLEQGSWKVVNEGY